MFKIKNCWGKEFAWDIVVQLMDDDICEELHLTTEENDIQEFYNKYVEKHKEKFGKLFGLEKKNPQIWREDFSSLFLLP